MGPLWVRLRTALAVEATGPLLAGGPALVLAPHPDDETIACGLLLAAKSAAREPVTVVLATDGRLGWFGDGPPPPPDDLAAVRSTEWHAALDALGVGRSDRVELGHPDGDLAAHEEAAATAIAALVVATGADQVVLPSPDDLHVDHRALARAALGAVASLSPADRPSMLVAYRVYPEAGLWPDGASAGTSTVGAALRLVRAVPGALGHRDLALRAPGAVPAKRRAVDAYVSQRRLLGSGVRAVWGTGTECFRILHLPTG